MRTELNPVCWRRVVLATIASLIGLLPGPTRAQERSSCLGGVPGAPSVFIDSAASEVTVVTSEGKRLSAARDLLLCPGDEVQTGATGRVAIRFDEKRTVIRLDGNSRTQVLSGGTGEADISLLSGILYFVSSVRRHFEVDTPYIVAGIDGTEALVTVRNVDSLAMTAVREGLVGAYDRSQGPSRTLPVAGGIAAFRSATVPFQSAPIGSLPPPFRDLLIVSDSAVDWAVYYPPIMFVRDTRNSAVREAIVLLSSGDYERADEALDRVSNLAPAEAAALRTIIAVARNRLEEAERWSQVALAADPNFAPAHVAGSYVLQAKGDLNGALEFALAAAKIAPDDAHVTARVAELQMTIGDRRAALEAADRSLTIERTPLALFVAGLARLAAWHYRDAEALFEEAIALDPEAPLPRLGLGLAYIRQGKTSAGTWEIERAVAHDPTRASLRTWLGRAYFDEELTAKATEELRLAKEADPDDPTPYLFSALERYTANDPIGALHELQDAESRGEMRRVLRSERGLSEDIATRGAGLGRIFDVLGFDQLAINEGAEAADADPANPGAHRFLADAYRQRPGGDIAQTSEILRSQMLSPPSKTPVQPELGEAHLALLETSGPTRVTFAEFAPLFDADGFRFDASGLVGSQHTWGDTTAGTGLYRGASASVGQYHYETEGYRDNNDLRHDIFDAIATAAFSPDFSVFTEFSRRNTEGGDRRLNFDLSNFDPTFRSEVTHEVARLGFHAQPSYNSDVLGLYTGARLSSDDSITFPFGLGDVTTNSVDRADSAQVQYIRADGIINSVVGGSYIHNDRTLNGTTFGFPDPTQKNTTKYYDAYGYFYIGFPEHVTWTIGGSAISYENNDGSSDIFRLNPKLGVIASVGQHVNVRASYLRNVKPDLVAEQLIEPTSIASFNQLYDGFNGSSLEQVGAGLDLILNSRAWVGAEVIKRTWEVPLLGLPDAETIERTYRGYGYFVLSDNFALAAEILHEESKSDAPFDFAEWRTTSFPVTLSYFGPSGLFGSVQAEYVDHAFANPGVSGDDTFTLVNGALGYRLPRGAGILSLEVQNLFDERFNFQNRSIRPDLTAAPRFAPSRTLIARGTITF